MSKKIIFWSGVKGSVFFISHGISLGVTHSPKSEKSVWFVFFFTIKWKQRSVFFPRKSSCTTHSIFFEILYFSQSNHVWLVLIFWFLFFHAINTMYQSHYQYKLAIKLRISEVWPSPRHASLVSCFWKHNFGSLATFSILKFVKCSHFSFGDKI